MDQIAIIVLNWKQPQLTTNTVDSLLKITKKKFSYHIFIIDNKSPDNSFVLLEKEYKKNSHVSVLQTTENLGYVGGNNFGIEHALKQAYDYILLINNDVLVDRNFLSDLYHASTTKNFAITGPKIYFAPGFEFHKNRYKKSELGSVIWSAGGHMDWNNIIGSNIGIDSVDNNQYDSVLLNPDFLSGCCLLINTTVFRKIGLLDPSYFMYLEDVDFCQRAKTHGFSIAYIPKARIWHINAGSSSSGSSLHDYFLTRNRLIFASRYANLRPKIAVFRESLKYLLSNNRNKRTAVIDYFTHNWGKGSWQ
ncbi:MAG: glycosyltransferase family 2 protein [Patescibacteria group bacterium]|jgi:GT2 family glycosyltransferase